MRAAWSVFQKNPIAEASIDAQEFKNVLPLLGENVAPEAPTLI